MMGCWLLVLRHESLVRWLSLLRDDHHQHHQLAEKVLGWSFFGGGAISLSPCKNLVHLRKKAGRSVRYAVRFQPTGGKLAPRYHQVAIANGRYDFSNKSSLSWKSHRNHTQCFRTIRSWHDGNVKQYTHTNGKHVVRNKFTYHVHKYLSVGKGISPKGLNSSGWNLSIHSNMKGLRYNLVAFEALNRCGWRFTPLSSSCWSKLISTQTSWSSPFAGNRNWLSTLDS